MDRRPGKGIAAASRKLHFGRPAISMQIKNLEASLGVPLFVRRRRYLQLTDTGRLAQRLRRRFPESLTLEPILLPSNDTAIAHLVQHARSEVFGSRGSESRPEDPGSEPCIHRPARSERHGDMGPGRHSDVDAGNGGAPRSSGP